MWFRAGCVEGMHSELYCFEKQQSIDREEEGSDESLEMF